jgi:hypothetical protein
LVNEFSSRESFSIDLGESGDLAEVANMATGEERTDCNSGKLYAVPKSRFKKSD